MKVREIISENKQKIDASKPRNFVAKNAKMGGAGQHKDKKKAEKQGDVKHKNKQFAEDLAEDPNSIPQDWQEWNVMIMNNFYSGKYPDYSARYYSVVASSPEEAREVVLSNTEKVLKDLLARKTQDGKRVLPPKSALPVEDKRVGGAERIKPGSVTTVGFKEMLTPNGPMMLKFASGKIVDVQETHGVAETAPKGWEGTVKAMKKHKDIDNPYALANYMKNKGYKSHKKEEVAETATAGSTSAGNVAVGAVYKNKKAKMQKPGTNALDMKGGNLLTGGSIKR